MGVRVQVDDVRDEGRDSRIRRGRRSRAAAAGVAAALAVGAAAMTATTASAAPAAAVDAAADPVAVAGIRPADIPNPGPGFRVKFAYRVGQGVQTYTCDATGAWGAKSTPEATLYPYGFLPPVHHFAGPRWQARDGSTVVGAVARTVPKDGTIPWLLLDVTAHEGGGRQLADVTHISRVRTRGGVVPTGSCTLGATRAVPYGADYVFWTVR
jgi:uncharacterized protein DUF3455